MKDPERTQRRKNPLNGDWILVSPHRNKRPWLGATETETRHDLPRHDPNCPLCPGNQRANQAKNPDYQDTFVFSNDFGALMPSPSSPSALSAQPDENPKQHPLFQSENADGECRVICFSPQHNKTLPQLSEQQLQQVVRAWQRNYLELAEKYACVHIFENKGAIMGCSQPHPHGQVWAHNHLSSEIALEDQHQADYQQRHGSSLLGDYVSHEMADGRRVVVDNAHWLVVVPFWAAWPFETLVIAKDDIRHFGQLNDAQIQSLAQALKILTTRYDNVFNCSFPYSMGWHNAPGDNVNNDNRDNSHWRLHGHFYPPLLRSASVKKHMVGYEMLAESQRDLSAESAADILNSVSDIHYTDTDTNTNTNTDKNSQGKANEV